MPDTSGSNSSREREIARLFAAMREADARQAPAIPDAAALAQRRPPAVAGRPAAMLPRVAAGVVLAVLVGLLTLDRAPRDPGELYTDIMSDSYLMTDPLLSVSPGLSPEKIDTVGELDMEMSVLELN